MKYNTWVQWVDFLIKEIATLTWKPVKFFEPISVKPK